MYRKKVSNQQTQEQAGLSKRAKNSSSNDNNVDGSAVEGI